MDPEPKVYSWFFTISFSGNTNINIGNIFGDTSNYNKYCSKGEAYNMLQGKCVKFSCAHNYDAIGSKCIRRPSINAAKKPIENPGFDNCLFSQKVSLYIVLNNSTDISLYTYLFQLVMNTTKEIFLNVLSSNVTVITRKELVTKEFWYALQQTLLANPMSILWVEAISYYITSQKHQILTELYKFDLSRTFPNNKVCADPHVLGGDDIKFLSNCSADINNRTIGHSFISSWISVKRNTINRKLSICNQFYLHSNCPLLVLKSNYTITKNKSLIYEEGHGKNMIPVKKYLPLRYGVGICIDKASPITNIYRWEWIKVVRDVEYYISVIGTSISIVCYLCILITFMLFKELRNAPGLNAMGMCCSLLTADIAFIISLFAFKNAKLCKTIAVILHWSLLSATTWVLLIAFALASRF